MKQWECGTCHGVFSAQIRDLVNEDSVCPYCTNKKALLNFNTINVTHPDLLNEWDYIRNYLLTNPCQIMITYSDDVWWKCQKCARYYMMSPKRKIYFKKRNQIACPFCKGYRQEFKTHIVT